MRNGIILVIGLLILGVGFTSPDLFKADVESADTGIEQHISGLSAAEIEGIQFMREEEKLARDVYAYLYDIWQIPTFNNISASEQKHTDAVKVELIEFYGLDDPTALLAPGEFNNPVLQQLYDDLTAQGSISLVEALKVGAAIEEIDILDIEEYISQTDDEVIIGVYENLLAGSGNHLRAFVSGLSKRGVTYEPVYLTPAAYQTIVG